MSLYERLKNKLGYYIWKRKLSRKGCLIYSKHIPAYTLKNGIGSNVILNEEVICIGSNQNIGDWTYINGAYLYDVSIGKFCAIGYNISIGGGEHYYKKATIYPISHRVLGKENVDEYTHGKTIIGNDVWIGNNAVIKGGIEVGNGAVIAAGAVVVKDVPPYAIVAGIPAKVIRYRATSEAIEKVQDMKWWDWPIEKIIKNEEKMHMEIGDFVSEKMI